MKPRFSGCRGLLAIVAAFVATGALAATATTTTSTSTATSTSGSSTTSGTSTTQASKAGTPPPLDKNYAFRTRLYGNPQCQQFATSADAVFFDGQLSAEAKAAQLNRIEAQAKAAGCLQS